MQTADKGQVADLLGSRQSSLQGSESSADGLRWFALPHRKNRQNPIADKLQHITVLGLDQPDNHLKVPAKMVQQLIR
jgi:hypothetical protein